MKPNLKRSIYVISETFYNVTF